MNTPSHSSSLGRTLALILIGVGLLAVSVALYLLGDSSAFGAQATEFSAVPTRVTPYAAPTLRTVTDLDGKPVTLDAYRGSVVLVNLWATWCPPCREEMPTLQAFYEKYKDDGFVLIAINQEEPREVVEPFIREYGLTFPIWLDLKYEAETMFGTMNLPSSYVLDREGRVRLMWIGGIAKRNLEAYVPDLIKE